MTIRHVISAIFLCVVVAGCDGRNTSVASPIAPTLVAPPAASSGPVLANWSADATVISRTLGGRPPCGWGTAIGETRTDVGWRITFGGKSLLLEEDMSNWPTDHITYEATLTGTQFTATYSQGADYLNWV